MNCIFFRWRGGSSSSGSKSEWDGGAIQVQLQFEVTSRKGAAFSSAGGVRVRGREVLQRDGGGQFEFQFDFSSNSGSPAPPVLVKLGFNSGSTNLINKTCESISQKKILNRPLYTVHFLRSAAQFFCCFAVFCEAKRKSGWGICGSSWVVGFWSFSCFVYLVHCHDF